MGKKKKRNPFAALLRMFKTKKTKNKKRYTRKTKHADKLVMVLAVLMLAGCSSVPKFLTNTVIKMPEVSHPAPPPAPRLGDVEVMVMNKERLEELVKNSDSKSAFILVDPRTYEIIITNFQELKRFIIDQKAIIRYYKRVLKQE